MDSYILPIFFTFFSKKFFFFQHQQSLKHTVACEKTGKNLTAVLYDLNQTFDKSFNLRVIKKEDVVDAMVPLCRFVCSFPCASEIEGLEEHFAPHPEVEGHYGITSSGLGLISGIVVSLCLRRGVCGPNSKKTQRAFWFRRKQLTHLRWTHVPGDLRPAEPEVLERALEVARFRADASATGNVSILICLVHTHLSKNTLDELMNSARNRVIARCMPKRTLYEYLAQPYVASKDFYLA